MYVKLDAMSGEADRRIAAEDGLLWVRITPPDGYAFSEDLRWYRSLATGFEHCWFNHEVEEQSDEGG